MKRRITAIFLAVLMIMCAFAGCVVKNSSAVPEDAFIGTWTFEGGMTLGFSKGDAQYKFTLAIEGIGAQEGIYTATESELKLNYADGSEELLEYVFENGNLIINGGMVFTKTAGGASGEKLTMSQILVYAVVGFTVVFAVLFVLFIVITIQGKVIDGMSKKPQETVVAPQPTVTEDEVLLVDTDEETAAMIMAIVADETGIPLEELYFKSIKLVEEGEVR